jgi:glutaredoxin-like protein NrdH
MADRDIILYSLTTCIFCKRTKEFLDECGAKYECVLVDQLQGDEHKKVVEDIKKVNPKLSFPTLVIDGEAIIGFKQDQIEEALR